MVSKRVVAPKPGNKLSKSNRPSPCSPSTATNVAASKEVQPILKEVTDKSHIAELDPSSCIPLYLFRKRSNNAVKKLKAIFLGQHSMTNVALPGIVSGTPTSAVVPLIGELEHYIKDYLLEEGYTEEDLEEKIKKHEKWFGVIDGCQFYSAIMELRQEYPDKWMSFKWPVLVVRPGKSLADYRKLARIQNERNKDIYTYESTTYDLLHGLRLEYDILYNLANKKSRTGRRGVKINHKDVAHNYDGADHSSNTYIKQAVSVSSRLSPRTIEAIGEVCNLECPDIILKSPSLNRQNLGSVDDVISHTDCRLFRSFICFGSLRGAKAFMNAVLDDQEEAQRTCIYRLKHWCELNGYKPVQSKTVIEQFNLSILSLKEEEKFLKIIESDEWPKNMETTRQNVLCTTLCDQELSLNSGNGNDILPTIWKSFKRLHPGMARGVEETLSSHSPPESNEKENEESAEDPPTPPKPDTIEANDEEKRRKQKEEEHKRKMILRQEADKCLSECKIYPNMLSFDSFLTEVWTTDSQRVDFVISCISRDEKLEYIKLLPGFCKHVLKSGSYAFFVVSNSQYSVLEKAFRDAEFKVMDHAFQILYDKATLHRRACYDFPQKQGEIGILAKSAGVHPDGYSPEFSKYGEGERIQSDDVVKFASLVNLNSCSDKLKKPKEFTAIRKDEKTVELFKHMIKMLSPPSGSVMDPIAGAFTAAIACLETNRSCICLENDADCYRFAVGRARIFATPGATMQQLDEFAEPIDVDALDAHDEAPSSKRRKIGMNSRDNNPQSGKIEGDAPSNGNQGALSQKETSSDEDPSPKRRKVRTNNIDNKIQSERNEGDAFFDGNKGDIRQKETSSDQQICDTNDLTKEKRTAQALLMIQYSNP